MNVPKDLLSSLIGSWEGTCRTWFEPGKLADESTVKGTIRPLLGELFVRHEYTGTIQGKPRHGDETIAFNSVTKKFVDPGTISAAVPVTVSPLITSDTSTDICSTPEIARRCPFCTNVTRY